MQALEDHLFLEESEWLWFMVGEMRFDVFLCHNSADKPTVRRLKKALEKRGLRVWVDESQLVPGFPWQEELESVISNVNAVAVLVGQSGLGPWEEPEMRAGIEESVRRKLSVIPVLLPGGSKEPKLPLFLKGRTWVDLREGLRKKGLDRLVWGITGGKPFEGGFRDPAQTASVQFKPILQVVHSDVQPLLHQRLLDDVRKSIANGKLRDSRIAPIILAVLRDEKQLEVVIGYDPSWMTVGIRLSDEYFVRVWQSAGERDWQRDFAQTATPVLVGTARSLKRSPSSQALMVKLCKVLAEQLRLSLVWPKEPDDFNDLVNAIFIACLKATELESDDVLLLLKKNNCCRPRLTAHRRTTSRAGLATALCGEFGRWITHNCMRRANYAGQSWKLALVTAKDSPYPQTRYFRVIRRPF